LISTGGNDKTIIVWRTDFGTKAEDGNIRFEE